MMLGPLGSGDFAKRLVSKEEPTARASKLQKIREREHLRIFLFPNKNPEIFFLEELKSQRLFTGGEA